MQGIPVNIYKISSFKLTGHVSATYGNRISIVHKIIKASPYKSKISFVNWLVILGKNGSSIVVPVICSFAVGIAQRFSSIESRPCEKVYFALLYIYISTKTRA